MVTKSVTQYNGRFRSGSIVNYFDIIIPDTGNQQPLSDYMDLWRSVFDVGNPLVSPATLDVWPYQEFSNTLISGTFEIIG